MEASAFIDAVQTEWTKLESGLDLLTDEQMLQPGTDGSMSLKDVLAHITWYEREMVNVVAQRALLGSDWWNLTLDERNANIYCQNQNVSLNDCRDEARRVHYRLMEALGTLTTAELNDAACFDQMPPEWIPWEVIASNTFEHYPQHHSSIEKLRIVS